MALKGDFIGFSFNGFHSSDLGIIRTSEGSRYKESLLPPFQDQTVQIPGGDGSYYFGTTYANRQFSISIAFDELSEENFRKMRTVFSGEEMGKLIFDEAPYKYYMVKMASPPQLNYICFGKTGEPRVYKGEGTLTFVAFYPFARSVHLSLAESSVVDEQNNTVYTYYKDFDVENREEWADASRLPMGPVKISGESINIENAGDKSMPWVATYKLSSAGNAEQRKIKLKEISCGGASLGFDDGIILENGDSGIQIDTKKNLIRGVTFVGLQHPTAHPTSNVYNKYITKGDFFEIPLGTSTFNSYFFEEPEGEKFICSKLDYEYIYY